MELYNDQVPGDTVWALQSRFEDWMTDAVDWYLTAEASSEAYRMMVQYMTEHDRPGITRRWKIILPRPRMDRDDVLVFVEGKLIHEDPDGTAQLLDVSVRKPR